MSDKNPKPPLTQRSFANSWGELDYLCKKIRYWLYARKYKLGAKRYVDRLESVLAELPENQLAIIREEALALLYELQGKLGEAIAHRNQEIQLMERLHSEAHSSKYSNATKAYLLRNRGVNVLQQRRRILAALKKRMNPKVAI